MTTTTTTTTTVGVPLLPEAASSPGPTQSPFASACVSKRWSASPEAKLPPPAWARLLTYALPAEIRALRVVNKCCLGRTTGFLTQMRPSTTVVPSPFDDDDHDKDPLRSPPLVAGRPSSSSSLINDAAPGARGGAATSSSSSSASPRGDLKLRGHRGMVRSSRFSPDGKKVVTASDDNTARLWDAETGALLQVLEGHTGVVFSCALSLTRVVTVGLDKTAKLWDSESGALQRTLSGHTNRVAACAFSPDGRRVMTVSWDREARIWDAATGEHELTLRGHKAWLSACCFSNPDGRTVVTSSWDATCRLWDARTGARLRTLRGHAAAVFDCVFSFGSSPSSVLQRRGAPPTVETPPTPMDVVRGGAQAPGRTNDGRHGGAPTAEDRGGDTAAAAHATGAASSSVGAARRRTASMVLSASQDRTGKVWDVETGACLVTLEAHDHWVTSCAFSPDDTRVRAPASPSARSVVTPSSPHMRWRSRDAVHVMTALSPSTLPPPPQVLTVSYDETVRLWDARAQRPRSCN